MPNLAAMGPATRNMFEDLFSRPFVELHETMPGGFLNVHTDFQTHTMHKHWTRQVNLLVFLNKDWQESYKGWLELWDAPPKKCAQRILPVFNRCVIFSTTDDAFHGHPETLLAPQGVTRKSLALYYYSNGRPEDEATIKHTTLFRRRPEESSLVGRFVNAIRYRLARLFRKLAYAAEPDRKTIRNRKDS